ncbi:MAG: response regulator receiver protein [Saprospiraceae bacterium]|nr:response regulator receiver protein [Saprospiraceae bacterium]
MSKNKNRRRPINVLMIDDDEGLSASIKNRARRFNVIITTATNFKDGFRELENNQKYQAVILDGKAPMNSEQVQGTEAENFVHESIIKLKELELLHERTLPFCVHTAWYIQLEPSLRNRAKIFDKKKTSVNDSLMEEMFEYLHQQIGLLETTKIKLQHPEVFEFSETYLDDEDNAFLVSILSPKLSSKREDLMHRLGFIRRLEESILNVYCKECLKIDPIMFGQGKDTPSRGKDLIDHIKNKKLAPLHISFMTYVIYSTQSIAINHKAPESSEYYNYPITVYTVQTFINALLDIIIWVKDSIENGVQERTDN